MIGSGSRVIFAITNVGPAFFPLGGGRPGGHDGFEPLKTDSRTHSPQMSRAVADMTILLTESQLQDRVKELGRMIEADYEGRPLTIVAVLTGSIILLADLIRQIRIPLRVALLQASSYQAMATEPGVLQINEGFAIDVTGRHILLLDDILDTGQTLATLVERIREQGPLSVKTAVLLRKIGRQQIPIEPDYCGFEIPNTFVVGYGLDHGDEYRHLPHVAVLDGQGPRTP